MSAHCFDGKLNRERQIEEALPLVRSLARRYANRGERFEDLVQVGTIGLINAVDRFEPDRGVPFVAYATSNIVGEIKRHLRDRCDAIRIPRRAQEISARVRATRRQLASDLRRDPTAAELATAAELNERDVADAVHAEHARAPVELTPSAACVEDVADAADNRMLVTSSLRSLHPRERQALSYRYFVDLRQSEIAEQLGVSQTQASRLIASGLAKLNLVV
jgi:RNA polymerase sigma-B factor